MTASSPAASDSAATDLDRRKRAYARWEVQSRRIALLRKALPAAIAILLSALVTWIAVRALLSALNEAKGAAAAIHMTDAEFHGRNQSGRPYIVHAREATRDGVDPNLVTLKFPIFQMSAVEDAAARRMTGDAGAYHDDRKMLYMNGHVVLDDGQGSIFHSDRAVIDINKDTAAGDTRVVGDGPQGHIVADSYSVDQKGQHIVFHGHVHGRFLPQKE